ncbi:hypothetical protein ACS0TY_024685 [Phlomoides rotata]
MGGKSRKKLNKSNSRGPRASASSSSGNRGLFVDGGFLSDWPAFNSPPSRGRKANNGGNRNSRSGVGKGSNSDPNKPGSAPAQRSEPKKSRGNAYGYLYPQPQEKKFVDGVDNQDSNFDASNPIVLIDSEKTPIIAYLDEGPVKESQNVEYLYDYTTNFTLGESSHRGLGFHDEVGTTIDGIGSLSMMEEKDSDSVDLSSSEEVDTGVEGLEAYHGANAEIGEDLVAEISHSKENLGYVMIGGTKIYTQDISDEGEEEELSDEEESGSSDSEDCSGTSESDDMSYSGSDIDDEVAADYFEGIGGVGNIINVDQLVGQIYDESDEDSDSEDSFDKTVQKLSGINLQEASREYGMKKTGRERKNRTEVKNSTPVKYVWSSALDDLMLVKDPRTISGKKKNVARPQQLWPAEARKSKKFSRRIPGEKKKHRKETIATKRRDRMIRRGVDVHKINLKLEQIVLDGVDMHSFTPMHPRDCTQVQRLAAIYRLRSGCQGSGKKRFVTVVRTQHTCMPSAAGKIHLEKLIGADDEDADFSVNDTKPVKGDMYAAKRNTRVRSSTTPVASQSSRKKSSKNLAAYSTSTEGKKNQTGKVGSYASQPLSFVSSGIMTTGTIESTPTESNEKKDKLASSSVEYGAFEMHTTGFGSKMMAKMGYVEGEGLGKDGRGIAQPIEVFQRPKSLGLGADAPESGKPTNTPPQQPKSIGHSKSSETKRRSTKNEDHKFGSFEKHTKGFGSKMMARMGFVEGMGLGRDSQGIVNPLSAVRRPKSVGLGAAR